MKTTKKYSWNRNVSHHRIALSRFALYAYIMSVPLAMLTTVLLGRASDGSRDYVVKSAIGGGLIMVGSFLAIFVAMSVMYRWICDMDAEREDPPTPPQKVVENTYYQRIDGGWELVGKEKVKGWGGNVNQG